MIANSSATPSASSIAESENLLAASVKRVANRLGVPAPRLEQYLPSRDDLFELMLDVALGEVKLADAPDDADWRAQLAELAEATYTLACQHPWLVELIGGRPPSGPNGLRYVERALTAFARTGLDPTTAALCFNAVLSYVSGCVRTEVQYKDPMAGDRAEDKARYLTDTISGADYPYLSALLSDSANVTNDASFAHGLACLLDGIALRVEAVAAVRSAP